MSERSWKHDTMMFGFFFLFVRIRVAEVWEELQVAVDQLPEARHSAMRLLVGRGAHHHPSPQLIGQQVHKKRNTTHFHPQFIHAFAFALHS